MNDAIRVACCVVGGGPAGMMLGYCLARAGVTVAVLEKHADFLRDFRGDTVHPSTMRVLDELGLLDRFLARPHAEVRTLGAHVGADRVTLADFSHLRLRTNFLAFMPQWDFLSFLADEAHALPAFRLLMSTAATGTIVERGRVVGVTGVGPDGPLEVRATVVVATDGRHSTMRAAGGFAPIEAGAPMDVLWMRFSRRPSDGDAALGNVGAGAILIAIDRGEYWQCGYVIPKGSLEQIRAAGLDALRRDVVSAAPFLSGRVNELRSWDDVKLLEVAVNHVARWHRPGLLLIGDAAHAMSPIGGVGINLAVQDAVAAANRLAAPLRAGRKKIPRRVLAAIQRRRAFPARVTQRIQVAIQNVAIAPTLRSKAPPRRAPLPLRIVGAVPFLQRIPAYVIGIGVRPEHVGRNILCDRDPYVQPKKRR